MNKMQFVLLKYLFSLFFNVHLKKVSFFNAYVRPLQIFEPVDKGVGHNKQPFNLKKMFKLNGFVRQFFEKPRILIIGYLTASNLDTKISREE